MALVLALLTAAGLLVVAGPGRAEAASCGARKVRTLSFSTGYVHVYKRGGYVCAVTVAKRRNGTLKWMFASVQARGNRPMMREGKRRYRISTDAVHAGRRCVRVEGAVGGGSVSSEWILC
ncbi:hypothetical protein ACFS5L_04345 [Streptomyces phyllanthi]|uniref:Secreted protein n=1 Tax=Streptomyces phyllanthi TaxID=1803180 RepID=A0A5N8W9Q0_9ACTN|nr:hypothetical protein [Streptomyces phyllanthi]MPY44019.1 hypothetical protein [Streptomyces phyllanthi]